MQEQFPPCPDYFNLEKRNVLLDMNQKPDFWDTISRANQWLNVGTGNSSDDPQNIEGLPVDLSDPEEEAVDIAHEALEFIAYEQPVSITGEAYRRIVTEDDEQDEDDDRHESAGTLAVKGDLLAIRPISIMRPDSNGDTAEIEQNLIALYVATDDDILAFPIEKSSLLVFEMWDEPLEKSPNALPSYIADLRKIATQVRFLTHSQDFYTSIPDEQLADLCARVQEMNEAMAIYNYETLFRLGVTRYIVATQTSDGALDFVEHTTDAITEITGENCCVVIPELAGTTSFTSPADFPYSEGEPLLELSNPIDTSVYWIPFGALRSFDAITLKQTPSAEAHEPSGLNLLLQLNQPATYGALQAIALEASVVSEDETVSRMLEWNNQIDSLTGLGICGRNLCITGTIYTENEAETYLKTHVENALVYGVSYDIAYIEHEWRVIIVIEYNTNELFADDDGNTRDVTEIGYIIPEDPFCTQCLIPTYNRSHDSLDKNLTEKLAWVARDSRRAVYSHPFKRSSLPEQQAVLEKIVDELDEIIQPYKRALDDGIIYCLATGSLCLPLEYEGSFVASDAPYVLAKDTTEDGCFTIEGDMIGCGFLEYSRDRTTAYDPYSDFSISGGEPMVMIENTQTGYVYFIKATDIIRLSQLHDNNDAEK